MKWWCGEICMRLFSAGVSGKRWQPGDFFPGGAVITIRQNVDGVYGKFVWKTVGFKIKRSGEWVVFLAKEMSIERKIVFWTFWSEG